MYVQVAAGLFGGMNLDLDLKFFGKAVLHGHAFGQTYDAIKLEVQFKKSGRSVYKRLYARIGGTTFVDVDDWDYNVLPEFSPASFSSDFSVSTRRSLYNYQKPIFFVCSSYIHICWICGPWCIILHVS